MTISETEYEINHDHISGAAEWAAAQLRDTGIAHVELFPGDRTRYEIVVTCPSIRWGEATYGEGRVTPIVSLVNFGTCYPWDETYLIAGYAAEKWGKGSWATGVVVAAFLNALLKAGGLS